LDTAHQRGGAKTGKNGILANRFKTSATEGRALHVDGGPENDVCTLANSLLAHLHAGTPKKRQVEGGS